MRLEKKLVDCQIANHLNPPSDEENTNLRWGIHLLIRMKWIHAA